MQNLTPEQEAERHFAGIYSSTTTTRDVARWYTDNWSECPPLEVEQVVEAIKSYPEGKAPGNDGIDRRALMMLTKAPMLHGVSDSPILAVSAVGKDARTMEPLCRCAHPKSRKRCEIHRKQKAHLTDCALQKNLRKTHPT